MVLGIALGAGIHGYVPEDFLVTIMGHDAPWWAMPVAVLLGVPMYSNAAGVIPIVEALLGKGAALGTVLAFMMSVIALSAPEMIILRKVLKPRLIATFVGVVAAGILMVGNVFNAVLLTIDLTQARETVIHHPLRVLFVCNGSPSRSSMTKVFLAKASQQGISMHSARS